MPAFGQQETGVGIIPLGDREDARKVQDYHRNRERDRMNIPEEPEPITRLSEEQRVFIYNAGFQTFLQPMGSYGSLTIPGLPAEKCLTQDLFVAGPLVIDGIPKEYYPADGEAKVLYHRPKKSMGRNARHPGFDFAMEVIGNGFQQHPSSDLRRFGVFVSDIIEQKKPHKNATPEVLALYEKWQKMVLAAQLALRMRCADACMEANDYHAKGTFAQVRDEKFYQYARLIKKTEADCPWLKDTGEAAQKEACPGCGMTIKLGIIKCPHCTMRVCDDETWEKVKGRYA